VNAEIKSRERAILETELNERKRSADAIQQRLEFEETSLKCPHVSWAFRYLDMSINGSLADIGRLNQASRGYLFLLHSENNIMDRTHEWYADGRQPINEMALRVFPVRCFPNGWQN